MILICQKSGLQLQVCDDGWNLKAQTCHAIFLLEKPKLLEFLQRRPAKTAIQHRLAFLALLNITGLCDWAQPFQPTDEEITIGLPSIARLHGALDRLSPQSIATLPRLRIAPDVSILDILEIWNKLARGLPVEGYANSADIALKLSEEYHKHVGKKLAPSFIEFAIKALLDVENDERVLNSWRAALALTTDTVQIFRLPLLQQLSEALQDCLPLDDVSRHKSFLIQRHVQNLIDCCIAANAELGGNKVARKALQIAGVGSFELVEISKPDAQALREKFTAPEPKPEDFQRSIDYTRARARWIAAKMRSKQI